MGIRGLTAFLKQGSLSSISDHVDMSTDHMPPVYSTTSSDSSAALSRHLVVIDGNAFSHWFCMECFGVAPSLNTNYRLLKLHVISWILKCYASKVDCAFVFDGATEPDKLQCRLDRLCKQSANMNFALSRQPLGSVFKVRDRDQCNSYRFNESNSNTNANGGGSDCIKLQSTPPLLAISCIISAIGHIRDLGTQVCAFYAKGEADKTITEVALVLKATAIMSNDSDMLIYDTGNVGFIPFWAFGFADDGSLNAFVIKRRKVANVLGIVEVNLPLLAALVGNDFTSPEVCYDMHKIIFEGTAGSFLKTVKTKLGDTSEETLTLDKLELSLSDIDESLKIVDGKRQRTTPKSKAKRSDPSTSASDRLKGRRRANRLEEENKRKINHISRNRSETSLLPTSYSTELIDNSMRSSLLQTESVIEMRSSLEKCIQPYGESALRTVRAAADFLKKLEAICMKRSGDKCLTPVIVTSCLLNITEEEVHMYLSQRKSSSSQKGSDTPSARGTKMASLCVLFHAAFEDSSQRYSSSLLKLSSLSPIPVSDTSISENEKEYEFEYGRSSLRCCFRCHSCKPKCSDLYSGSLSKLLKHPSAFHEKIINLESASFNFSSSSSLPSTAPTSTSTSASTSLEPTVSVCRSSGSFPVKNIIGIMELSPDMEQVLQYKMFIGRTPCSLQLPRSKSVSSALSESSSEKLDVLFVNGKNSKELTELVEIGNCISDYVLLQPIRKRIFSELFNQIQKGYDIKNDSVPKESIEEYDISLRTANREMIRIKELSDINIIEIYKKNSSPALEKRNLIITQTYCDSSARSYNEKNGVKVTLIENQMSELNGNNATKGGCRKIVDWRLQLMDETVTLMSHTRTSGISILRDMTSSLLESLSLVRNGKANMIDSPGRVENQLFVLLLVVGLYVDVSLSGISSSSIDFIDGTSSLKNIHRIEISSESSLSANSTIEDSEKIFVFVSAVAFLLSCTITLIQSEVQSSNIDITNQKDALPALDSVISIGDKTPVNASETKNSEYGKNIKVYPSYEKNEKNIEDFCENDNLNLHFINTWTRFQLCYQHTNFSVEVAARKLSILIDYNELELEPDVVSSFLRLASGGDLGLVDPTLFSCIFTQLQELLKGESVKHVRRYEGASRVVSEKVRFDRKVQEVRSSLLSSVRNVLLANSVLLPSHRFESYVNVLQTAVKSITHYHTS